MDSPFLRYFKSLFIRYINISDQVDTEAAAERIKSGIWFQGANVWILAFAIVLEIGRAHV